MHSMCIIMSIQNNTHDAHASQEELNMKKYLALLLAAIMALSLAACALSLIHISEPTRPY